jgi:hypothetical protein
VLLEIWYSGIIFYFISAKTIYDEQCIFVISYTIQYPGINQSL